MLEEFVQSIAATNLKYILVFLVALAESIIFLNPIVPGQTIVVLAGIGAQQGIFNLGLLIATILIAVVLGDCITYYIGRRYGMNLLKRYGGFFFFKKEYLNKTRALMRDHLGKSILLGHMHGFTRALVPFISGAHRSSFKRFLFFTFFGALIWTLFSVLLGYFLGESYHYIERYAGIIVLLIIISALSWYYIASSVSKKNAMSNESKILWILGIAGIFFFWSILRNVSRKGFWITLDQSLSSAVQRLNDEFLTYVARFIEVIFDVQVLMVVSIVIFFWYIFNKKHREATFFGAAMLAGALILYGIKEWIHRARPDSIITLSEGFSFPSGHATIATLFIGLLLYAFWKTSISRKYKMYLTIFSIFLVVMIGASRIYLNAHWLSDVIAGFTLGASILVFARLCYNAWDRMFKNNRLKFHTYKK
ncbi:phosphatase PAP2 family protein [Candidatus Pacearchaeota archaeon]|nr:phosphatase PAP2 family protein [Candidatus Pacearchaeota archaeon]